MSRLQWIVPKVGSAREKLRSLYPAAGLAVWTLWLVGQIVRDATWATSLLFYVPSPFVALLLLALGIHLAFRKKTASFLLFFLLAVVPVCFVIGPENRWSREEAAPTSGESLRLVHWNVCYGKLGWSGVGAALRQSPADIYVLSESVWQNDIRLIPIRLGEGFEVREAFGMVIASRGRVVDLKEHGKKDGVRVFSALWHRDGHRIKLLVVDLVSDPFCPRDPRLRHVIDLIRKEDPDIVVGDFNAPRRSLALSSLPRDYFHAYDVAGKGWGYTWPTFFPIFAIDQCIVGPRVIPLRYDLESSWHSDHRMQVLEFTLRD